MKCPCCNQSVSGAYPLDEVYEYLTPLAVKLVKCLSTRPGTFYSARSLAAEVWPGLDRTPANVADIVRYCNPVLNKFGWRITSRRGPLGGWALNVGD